MTHPNEDLVRQGYAAFASGDTEALVSQFFDPDIRWHFPGRTALSGHHEGAAEVAGMFGLLAQMSGGTHRTELHDVIANDGHAVAMHTARAERAGKQLEINAVNVFHIRDGKVIEAWTLHADSYGFDEFYS